MAAPAFVKDKSAYSGGSVEVSATFTGSTTANNLVVVCCAVNSAASVDSVYDNKTGNTYSLAVSNARNADEQVFIYYSVLVDAGSTHTVTFKVTSSSQMLLYVVEVSGADTSTPLDKTSSQDMFATGDWYGGASGDIDTAANVFCIGAYNPQGMNSNQGTPGTNWTERYDDGIAYYQTRSSDAALTDERGYWACGSNRSGPGAIASFKAAAAAAARPLPQRVFAGPHVGPFRGPF